MMTSTFSFDSCDTDSNDSFFDTSFSRDTSTQTNSTPFAVTIVTYPADDRFRSYMLLAAMLSALLALKSR